MSSQSFINPLGFSVTDIANSVSRLSQIIISSKSFTDEGEQGSH